MQDAILRERHGLLQGIKGTTLLLEPREKESARVRSHLMRALNADTVAASMGLLSDTVHRSIAVISRCAVAGSAADEGSQRRPSVDASAPPPRRFAAFPLLSECFKRSPTFWFRRFQCIRCLRNSVAACIQR